MRTFVALELCEGLRGKLAREATEWAHLGHAVRWVREPLLHLTLRFLGEVAEKQLADVTAAVEEATQRRARFALTVQGRGAFPGGFRPARVLWAGVEESAPLRSLAQALEGSLVKRGFVPADRPFSAHVTLARVRGRLALPGSWSSAAVDYGEQPVEHVTVFESKVGALGAAYQVRAVAPLAG